MGERLDHLDSQIAHWQAERAEAIHTIAEANQRLLELGSERNLILGKVATRRFHVVPNVQEIPRTPRYDSPPDGAA